MLGASFIYLVSFYLIAYVSISLGFRSDQLANQQGMMFFIGAVVLLTYTITDLVKNMVRSVQP